MSTGEILRSYSAGQKATVDGSEYIYNLFSRANALNYPAVALHVSSPLLQYFLEKITVTLVASTRYEVYLTTSVAALAAPALSSSRFSNKKRVSEQASIAVVATMGEITPAQYNALVLLEDIFTIITTTPSVLDFSNSNFLFQANPAIPGSISAIILVSVGAASEIYAAFEGKQINLPSNIIN